MTANTSLLLQHLYRLILHEHQQLYSVWLAPDYLKSQGSKPLTTSVVSSHIQGLETIAVRLLQPGTNTAKAGCIDFDAPKDGTDAQALQATFAQAWRVKEAAEEQGLPSYIEFSGRRGFHLWLFASSSLPGTTWIKALQNLCEQAGYKPKEIYPATATTAGDGKESGRPIKLPCGIHKTSGKRSGFLTTSIKWVDGFPVVPQNQAELLASFQQIPASAICVPCDSEAIAYQLRETQITEPSFAVDTRSATARKVELGINNNGSYLSTQTAENSTNTTKCTDFSILASNEHPVCIHYLLNSGAPTDQDYNSVNVTLSRYAITRGLSDEQARKLAKAMAKASGHHPSSKTTVEAKVRNFGTSYASALRHAQDYQWNCSYIRNSKELVKGGGCTGWNCVFWPWEKLSNNSEAARLAERELLTYILHHPEEGMQEALGVDIPPEGFITTYNPSHNETPPIYLHQLIWESLVSLETQGQEIVLSLILSKLEPQLYTSALNRAGAYLDELIREPSCSFATFKEHLLRVRDTGLRILAKEQTATATDRLSKHAYPVSKTLDALINQSQNLQRRGASEISPLIAHTSELIRELFGKPQLAIATPAKWLNNALNGGFHPGRLYVIGAPPGSGKTTWCAWCADTAAASGTPVLYVAFEMGKQQLWINALARTAGINSSLIEAKKWDDSDYPHADWLRQQVAQTIQSYDEQVAEYLTILEAGPEMTTAHLKGTIAQVRRMAEVGKQAPVLVIVDYLQLMRCGEEKLDSGANEVLRVSHVATGLKQLARDTSAAVVAISDINKAAYQDALRTGTLDMGALRDSFKIAHAADCIMLLQTGTTKRGNGVPKDQIALLEEHYTQDRDKVRQLQDVRSQYPLNEKARATYARLSILKNRGGMNAEPLFVYERAYHRFQPIDLDLGEWKEEADGDI